MDQPDFDDLVQQVMRRRRVYRPNSGAAESPCWLAILREAEATLLSNLKMSYKEARLTLPLSMTYMDELITQTFRGVLRRERLQELAAEVQALPECSLVRQLGLTNLIMAIKLSGHLSWPRGLSKDEYADVENRLFAYIAQHIDSYSIDKGEFMKWVNFRLGKIPYDMRRETAPTINDDIKDLIRRRGYKLKSIAKTIDQQLLWSWLFVIFKDLLPIELDKWGVFFSLSFLFSVTTSQNKRCWRILAASIVDSPLKGVVGSPEEDQLENIAAEGKTLSQIDLLRICLQEDRTGEYKSRHVRGHPEATFQRISLAYLDGMKWHEISQLLHSLYENEEISNLQKDNVGSNAIKNQKPIPVQTLSTFHKRSVERFKSTLAECINGSG